MKRRGFLQGAGIAAAGVFAGPWGLPVIAGESGSLSELPAGASPEPLSFEHFPSRLHAFVWRNWSLVPLARMAKVVGCRQADLAGVGEAMGLGKPPRITADQQRRSYITVIKRNWHLLPYDQLLALLDWTLGQFAYTLREDDFLFIKLGSLKPRCQPLRYQASDAATQEREAWIRRIVEEEFPEGISGDSSEPLFQFVRDLSELPSKSRRTASQHLRYCYSYFATYGDPLLEQDCDPYPEGLLARLAQAGVTGVWLQAVLYKLAPFPWQQGLSSGYEKRLKRLGELVARARRHGIRLFLYLNEPRAMPNRFLKDHSDLKGVTHGDHSTLCTSAPEVREYLTEAVASICRAVPDLGGFFSITASENLTNCWSHGQGAKCPRCGKLNPGEVIARVNRAFQDGITRAREPGSKDPGPRLIAWDWGWGDDWAPRAIAELPGEAALMSVSEWSIPIERGGVRTSVGEYSISTVGPGPRAARHWKLAQARGLRVLAKVQAGNTWELSAVPYIPALENVAQHAANLRDAKVPEIMLGWTLGGYPSPNLEIMAEIMDGGGTVPDAMLKVAGRRFGEKLAPAVVEAWKQCSAAFREFPYHIGVVYSAPLQVGPANLLWSKPTGYAATMVGFPYDDLNAWRAVYPPETFASQLVKVANGFDAAAGTLEKAGKQLSLATNHARALRGELDIIRAGGIHFRSVALQTGFVMARGQPGTPTGGQDRSGLHKIIRAELDLARRLHKIQCSDSRIGFEASNQYYYVPLDLVEKVLNCRDLLEKQEPSS